MAAHDARNEMPEETERLVHAFGQPLAEHAFSAAAYRKLMWLGMMCCLLGVVVMPLAANFVLPGWLNGMNTGLPGLALIAAGISTIVFARRDRSLWIFRYADGLFISRRDTWSYFAWTDFDSIRLVPAEQVVPRIDSGESNGIRCKWIALDPGRRRFLSRLRLDSETQRSWLELERIDGPSFRIPDFVSDFAALCASVQIGTYQSLMAEANEAFSCGVDVPFGDVSAGREGLILERSNRIIEWKHFERLKVDAGWIELTARKWWQEDAKYVHLSRIPNPHILLGLMEKAMAAEEPPPQPPAIPKMPPEPPKD